MSKEKEPSIRQFALTVFLCKGFHLSNRLASQAEDYLKLSAFRKIAWFIAIVCIVVALRISNAAQLAGLGDTLSLVELGCILATIGCMGYIYMTGDRHTALENFLRRERETVIRIAKIMPEWTFYTSVLSLPLSTLQIATEEALAQMAQKLPREINTRDEFETERELMRWNMFMKDFELCSGVGATEKTLPDFFHSQMTEEA